MKGRIPIRDAQEISERRACPVVVIFAIEPGAERFTVTTYGATKKLCRHAASMGKQIAEKVLDGTVAPEAIEPMELPDSPCMMSALAAVREKA